MFDFDPPPRDPDGLGVIDTPGDTLDVNNSAREIRRQFSRGFLGILFGALVIAFLAVGGTMVFGDKGDALNVDATTEATEVSGFEALSLGSLIGSVEIQTEDSLSLSISDLSTEKLSDLRLLLNELGFNSAAVLARMGNTRALDGTQNATGDQGTAYWSYHPDDGLSLVLEAK